MELMQKDSTEKRLDDLNSKVDLGFERVDGEVRALRAESRGEFSALRAEVRGESAALRAELRDESAALRAEMKGESAALRAEMKGESAALRTEVKGESAALRAEMKAGFDSVNERFDALHHLMIQFSGGLLGTVIVASAALIATQL